MLSEIHQIKQAKCLHCCFGEIPVPEFVDPEIRLSLLETGLGWNRIIMVKGAPSSTHTVGHFLFTLFVLYLHDSFCHLLNIINFIYLKKT